MWDTERREPDKFIAVATAGEYLNICGDDASRMACTTVLQDETAESPWSSSGLLLFGIDEASNALKDNRACYASRKFREACREFGIRHKRTQPYRPQTNGKAEQFIQAGSKRGGIRETYTLMEINSLLAVWTHLYNFVRSHSALGRKPPASWLSGG